MQLVKYITGYKVRVIPSGWDSSFLYLKPKQISEFVFTNTYTQNDYITGFGGCIFASLNREQSDRPGYEWEYEGKQKNFITIQRRYL